MGEKWREKDPVGSWRCNATNSSSNASSKRNNKSARILVDSNDPADLAGTWFLRA